MKKLLIASLVLVAALLVSTLYVWTETRGQGSAAERGDALPPAASPDEGAAAPASEGDSGSLSPITLAETGETAGDEPERRELDLDSANWIEGVLKLPAGTPADERAEIALLGKAARDDSRLRDAPSDTFWADPRILHRVEVSADGRFRVPLPEGESEHWIALHSRYLYLDGPRAISSEDLGRELVLEPSLGAWITGRILLPDGTSAELFEDDLTELELMFDVLAFAGGRAPPPGLRAPRTHALPDLSFEFRGVATSLDREVRVMPARLAAHKSARFAVGPGVHATVELALVRGGKLRGRVVDDFGQTVPHADVTATIDPIAFGQGGFEVRKTASDADGTFELVAVAPGKVGIAVAKSGLLERKLSAEVADGERAELGDVVLKRGESISGRVTWSDGKPVTDSRVEVEFDPAALGGMSAFNAMQGASSDARTDSDGHFVVQGLGKGPFVVSVAAKPDGSEREHRARAAGVQPGTKDLSLVLSAPLQLSGRVIDALGAPVAGARVRALEDTGGVLRGLGGRRVQAEPTGPDGAFALLDLAAGRWTLDATAEGYTRCAEVDVTLPNPQQPAVELRLERGGSVSGRVLFPDGTPARGATVRQKLSMDSLRTLAREDGRGPSSATAADDGSFSIDGLAAGTVPLIAGLQGWADSPVVEAVVAPEQETRDLVLSLRTGGRITGLVYQKDGNPAVGAQILAQVAADPLQQRFATSDTAGQFVFEHVVPGTYNVMHFPGIGGSDGEGEDPSANAAAMFGDMKLASAAVADGEEVHVVLGAPPKDPVEVSGRVTSAGEGVPGVVLSFIADGTTSMGGLKLATTDGNGRYSTRLDGPGRYAVSLQKPGVGGQQQTLSSRFDAPAAPSCEHDFRLPLGAIAGRVLDPDGKPAARARVSLTDFGAVRAGTLMGEHYSEVETDADGRYELIWLAPGAYTVAVGGAPLGGLLGGSASAGRQLRENVEVREDRRTDGIDFQLRKPGRVTGVVRDASGAPAADAAIFVRDAQGRMLERISMVATDSSGRFTYEGLEPGEYSLLARTSSDTSGEGARVRVEEGRTAEAELALRGGTILLVSLSGEDGEPLDCSVTVLDEAGRQVNGTLSISDLMAAFTNGSLSSKEQRVGPLAPGKYRVTVTADDGRKVTKPVSLSGQPERKLNVRL